MKYVQEIAGQTYICNVDNSELNVIFDKALDVCTSSNLIGSNKLISSAHLCISDNVTYRATINAESVDMYNQFQ